MIGTLFVQEFRSTRKSMLTVTGIMLVVAALGTGTGALQVPILGGLGYGLAIVAAVSLTAIVLALLVEHYWRTMYGRQGYFTMTLPVRGSALFTAKVLYGLAATYVAVAFTALTLLAISVVYSMSQGHTPLSFARDLVAQTEGAMLWFIVGVMLVQLTFAVITGAALISIGSEARFNHLGFGAPVIGYVILYFVMQILALAAMLFVPLGIVLTGADAGTIVSHGMFDDFIASIRDTSGATEPNVLGLGLIPLSVVVAAVFWWWGARSVDRRTSLR